MSSAARIAIREVVMSFRYSTHKELCRYLNAINNVIAAHASDFSEELAIEIEFGLSILEASSAVAGSDCDNINGIRGIREEFFLKTVFRAIELAKRRNGSLLCCVGASHAMKNGANIQSVEGYVPEASYFNTHGYSGMGGVKSYRIINYGAGEQRYSNCSSIIESALAAYPNQHYTAFLDLSRLSSTYWADIDKMYFPSVDKHPFDGIIAIWAENSK